MIFRGELVIKNYQNGYNNMKKEMIAYGIGQLFHLHKMKMEFDYVCDKRLNSGETKYEQYDVLTLEQLKHLQSNATVIVFVKNKQDYSFIKKELIKNKHLMVTHCFEVFPQKIVINKETYGIKIGCDGELKLENDNIIVFEEGLFPEKLEIILWGGVNNRIRIGKHISINDKLSINVGNNASVIIGDDFRVTSTTIVASFGEISIGNECLFSANIGIRNVNGHHIFDMETKKRIDTPKNIVVADNVWVCENVNLLPGACIGVGTIVGANSVTSSSFGDHLIIAGNPASIIRENIAWSRDSEMFFNHSDYECCYSSDFLNYL